MGRITPTSTHWGNFLVEAEADQLKAIHPSPDDEFPTPIGQSLLSSLDPKVRISQPMIREGYHRDRRRSDGSKRGQEAFVAVSWDEALDIAAEDLSSIKLEYTNEAIFGGSYGWASAGRFHHSQSQIHRFLNMFDGYVSTQDSYSLGAGYRICPYTTGLSAVDTVTQSPTWEDSKENADLFVCFGGIALKNTQVNAGGIGNHSAQRQMREMHASGIRFINISPIKDDIADDVDAEWLPLRPTTDTALMLGIAYVLYTENLYDAEFVEEYTVGFERFLPYLLGDSDGVPKDPNWASKISEVKTEDIVRIAREMSKKNTLIVASWSLQRAEHGEQPWWMAVTLASMLGYIGIPGCGVAYGYGSVHNVGFFGKKPLPFKVGAFPQGENLVKTFIPVARIVDMADEPRR